MTCRRCNQRRSAVLTLTFFALFSPLACDAQGAANAWAIFESGPLLDDPGPYLVAESIRTAGVPGLLGSVPFPMSVGFPDALGIRAPLTAFATEAGLVRVLAAADDPNKELEAGSVQLIWRRTFTKGLPSDIATFTISLTSLHLILAGQPVDDVIPSSGYTMTVRLAPGDLHQIGVNEEQELGWQEQFRHEVKLQANDLTPFLSVEKTSIGGAVVYDLASNGQSGRVMKLAPTTDIPGGYYQTSRFTGVVNLGRITTGTLYTVEYDIRIEVQKVFREGLSQGIVQDPLDVDGGFRFETTSAPADDSLEATCDAPLDAARFLDNGDGTVNDAHTGLMWQRCPLGYVLNAQGTTADLRDDTCDVAGSSPGNWQAALQAAASDALAGHGDWRVPNLKELESIVQLQCIAPTIDTITFPFAAPTITWSSTPDPVSGAAARIVDFALGRVSSIDKTASAETRLVRDSGEAPRRAAPAISVGRAAAVNESDAGTVALSFPIALDAVAATDVSVEYETRDLSALAGEDYVSTSGVATIPAGSRQVIVQVPVINDSLGEFNQALLMRLSAPSASARLRIDRAVGQIDDDEPVLTIAGANITEGDAGQVSLVFPVTLSGVTTDDVTVQFATADGTATAGADYVASSGTLRIPAGTTSGSVVVPVSADALIEGDETLTVTLSNTSANTRLAIDSALGSIVDDDAVTLRALNDTGITLCANESNAAVACSQTSAFPGQDAEFGRDATANNNADGAAGFSFTKLDATGTPLIDQAVAYDVSPWDCVQDEVTGLQWEVRTDNGGLRDKDWTYTWFNSTGINDGGSAGTANGGVCVDGSNCDTEKYVSAVNAVGLCGRTDWRLATREELQSIADISRFSTAPRYDINFFANPAPTSVATSHWTSTPDASAPGIAWSVDKLKGRGSAIFAKSRAFSLILVRGGN
ncbi:MAG TPA: DUF1566 domain-containing protein [Steroidobacteraceae bacterium]|nr:DUF1566 domain-containing protein [Steroidobacteraceae bacterium]